MNKAQQTLLYLGSLIEKEDEFDFCSDGEDDSFQYKFKDGSSLNMKVKNG